MQLDEDPWRAARGDRPPAGDRPAILDWACAKVEDARRRAGAMDPRLSLLHTERHARGTELVFYAFGRLEGGSEGGPEICSEDAPRLAVWVLRGVFDGGGAPVEDELFARETIVNPKRPGGAVVAALDVVGAILKARREEMAIAALADAPLPGFAELPPAARRAFAIRARVAAAARCAVAMAAAEGRPSLAGAPTIVLQAAARTANGWRVRVYDHHRISESWLSGSDVVHQSVCVRDWFLGADGAYAGEALVGVAVTMLTETEAMRFDDDAQAARSAASVTAARSAASVTAARSAETGEREADRHDVHLEALTAAERRAILTAAEEIAAEDCAGWCCQMGGAPGPIRAAIVAAERREGTVGGGGGKAGGGNTLVVRVLADARSQRATAGGVVYGRGHHLLLVEVAAGPPPQASVARSVVVGVDDAPSYDERAHLLAFAESSLGFTPDLDAISGARDRATP